MSESEVKAGAKSTPKPPKAPTPVIAAESTATKLASKSAKPVTKKPVAPAKAKPAAPANAASKAIEPHVAKVAKPRKAKLVRDSFTMPEAEYVLFAELKGRCLSGGVAAKKSEVLRAALVAFAAQSDANVFKAIKTLSPVKTGRPAKGVK